MALKTFKPTSPGQRHVVIVNRDGLWKGKPVKALTEGLTKSGGRGSDGRINSRHRGGGHKRTYRLIDFKRRKFDVPATVERLEYDPNRTGYIALIRYQDGEQSYILAPQRLKAGDSDGQVLDFLVARYGEFVLLRPPFEWHTALLWLAPGLLLLAGALAIVLAARRRLKPVLTEPALTAQESARLRRLTDQELQ